MSWWLEYGLPTKVNWAPFDTHNDRWVVQILKGMKNGVAVECGAWTCGPMTRVLSEHLGWKCLLIEPNPISAAKLRCARPNDIVEEALVLSDSQQTEFVTRKKPGYSGCPHLHYVPPKSPPIATLELVSTTLSDLFAKHDLGKIHYLCLDVEGAEIEALNGLDFKWWTPLLLSVETGPPERREDIRFMLSKYGYRQAENAFCNVDYESFFVHRSLK